MKRLVALCALSAALGVGSSDAAAQVRGSQGWSVNTGRTVGINENFLHVQGGWPGISATLLHGNSPTLDLGGIFTFNYGLEGDVNDVNPGLKLQALARLLLNDSGRYNIGLTFAPGPLLYFGHSTTLFGITVPVGLVVGIPVSSAANVNLGLDIPFWFYVTQGGGAVIPILAGGGVEYFVDRSMAITFNTRMGPAIYTGGGTRCIGTFCVSRQSFTDFALQVLLGVALRM
jgi:hypothetical protein